MTGSAIQVTGRTNYNQVYRKVITLPWEKWFAWYPVKVHSKRVWLKTVYRRSLLTYVDMDDWQRYEYGTIFDIIKE
jgi:predicted chitinase